MASVSPHIAKTKVSTEGLMRRKEIGRRICMVAYSFIESDTRILQYATALVQRGDTVDVIGLRREHNQSEFETLNGVNIYRIQERVVNETNVLTYGLRIARFLVSSTIAVARRHRLQPYALVHVHNVPDLLVLSALYPRVKGVPIILDIHDLLPEFYASKFKLKSRSIVFQILVWVERCSAAFATHIIVANHLWRDRLAVRSSRAEKCSVVRNRPDTDIFVVKAESTPKADNRFVLLYPGSLNHHQGVDIAIRAFASVADQMPDADFHIYGEGSAKPSLMTLASDLQMQKRVFFHKFLPSEDIAQVMARADLAIEPKRAKSAFGNEALSTKILEFMALGVPIVASRTATHAYYYQDSLIEYYDNDNEEQLAAAMISLYKNGDVRDKLRANGSRYAAENTWQAKKHEYLQLVDELLMATSKTKRP